MSEMTNTPAPATGQDSGPATPAPASAPAPVDGGQAVSDVSAFTNINPADLPAELQTSYRNMQADYTRKMQEIAAYRDLGDPNELKVSYEFVSRLRSDPNYAMAVYNELGGLLTNAGFPVEPTAGEPFVDDGSNLFSGGEAPFDEAGISSELETQLSELKQWRDQIDFERREARYEAELSRQQATIQQQHPEYTESDINNVYQLAFSTNGNLFAANEVYKNMRQSWASGYLDQKATVPSAHGSMPPVTGSAQQPSKFESLQDPNLGRAVEDWLRARYGE